MKDKLFVTVRRLGIDTQIEVTPGSVVELTHDEEVVYSPAPERATELNKPEFCDSCGWPIDYALPSHARCDEHHCCMHARPTLDQIRKCFNYMNYKTIIEELRVIGIVAVVG